METIVVNLFGVPGSGKSTCAAEVFAKLKRLDVNAELITEYAKDKIWEENDTVFENQFYVTAKQSYRQSRCRNKVDVMVTDSPLPVGLFFTTDPILLSNSFKKTVLDIFASYNNVNFFLNRVKKYNPKGRFQTEEESNNLVTPMKKLLDDNNIQYTLLDGNEKSVEKIVKRVMELVLQKQ